MKIWKIDFSGGIPEVYSIKNRCPNFLTKFCLLRLIFHADHESEIRFWIPLSSNEIIWKFVINGRAAPAYPAAGIQIFGISKSFFSRTVCGKDLKIWIFRFSTMLYTIFVLILRLDVMTSRCYVLFNAATIGTLPLIALAVCQGIKI